MSNQWKIIPVDGVYEYSDEIKEFAHTAALKAALSEPIEFVDVDRNVIPLLGKKWEIYFLSAYTSLKKRYRDAIDDLIMLSDRMDRYASVYEATLRKRAAELSGENDKQSDTSPEYVEICGTLLLQHCSFACIKELLRGTQFEPVNFFPGTGDILAALSVNRIMQAALCIDADLTKALDLLSDSMAAKFFNTQGTMHLESFYALKNDRKVFGEKGAAAKLANDPSQKEKRFVRECWQEWQATPKNYKSKAAFARAMLEKCEHLTSQKKIEDWCRDWKKESKTVTLPAQ